MIESKSGFNAWFERSDTADFTVKAEIDPEHTGFGEQEVLNIKVSESRSGVIVKTLASNKWAFPPDVLYAMHDAIIAATAYAKELAAKQGNIQG